MTTFFILLLASFQYGFSMGSDQFIPGNPADAKDVPEIEDLNNLNRHTTTNLHDQDQQREEEKHKDEVTKKAPSRTKEKQ
jgi:hypothetical protein